MEISIGSDSSKIPVSFDLWYVAPRTLCYVRDKNTARKFPRQGTARSSVRPFRRDGTDVIVCLREHRAWITASNTARLGFSAVREARIREELHRERNIRVWQSSQPRSFREYLRIGNNGEGRWLRFANTFALSAMYSEIRNPFSYTIKDRAR